jgi:hypothetical protein
VKIPGEKIITKTRKYEKKEYGRKEIKIKYFRDKKVVNQI